MTGHANRWKLEYDDEKWHILMRVAHFWHTKTRGKHSPEILFLIYMQQL